MYWSTTITEEAPDKLSKREWRFVLYGSITVPLDSIFDYERTSLRHKYRTVSLWERCDQRENTMPRIEPPDAVKEEVRNRIQKELTFL